MPRNESHWISRAVYARADTATLTTVGNHALNAIAENGGHAMSPDTPQKIMPQAGECSPLPSDEVERFLRSITVERGEGTLGAPAAIVKSSLAPRWGYTLNFDDLSNEIKALRRREVDNAALNTRIASLEGELAEVKRSTILAAKSICQRHSRHVSQSPGVGFEQQNYAQGVVADILSDLDALLPYNTSTAVDLERDGQVHASASHAVENAASTVPSPSPASPASTALASRASTAKEEPNA